MPSPTQAGQSATLGEILSQPGVWRQTFQKLNDGTLLETVLARTESSTEWLFLGCGTSYYLAEAAAVSWTLLTGQRARALPASEVLLFPGAAFLRVSHLQAVVISRSGRTSEAVRAATVLSQKNRVPTLGITCAPQSPLADACDLTISLPDADEKSTVMTRSFTSMLLALQHLAARRAGSRDFAKAMERMAAHFASAMPALAQRMESFVAKHAFSNYVFLGQGPFFGIAREGSLKVTEMSCSLGQVFHTLEFRHGPKAIVSPETCLTFYVSEEGSKAECEVLAEMKALGGVIISICNRANDTIRDSSDFVFELEGVEHELTMLAPFVVPSQLLGFFTGIKKGLDPGHPNNLTRVVILD